MHVLHQQNACIFNHFHLSCTYWLECVLHYAYFQPYTIMSDLNGLIILHSYWRVVFSMVSCQAGWHNLCECSFVTCVSLVYFLLYFLCLQLAGTGVLAVGLWLRFDSGTAGLFDRDNSPTVFFTGEKLLLSQSCTQNDHCLHIGQYWFLP